MHFLRSLSAATLVMLAACDLSTEPDVPDPIDPAQDTYAPSLGINIATMTKTSTGLYYKDNVIGTGGAAATGDSVLVHYTLWLTNGTKVESSKDQTNPLPGRFLIGDVSERATIPGFQQGLIGMQPGGIRVLVIPPQLAWGSRGFPPVQPNANIVFQLEYVGRISSAQ